MLKVEIDTRGVAPLRDRRVERAIARALRKAGSTALRDMRSEARKRVRALKRLKARRVRQSLHPRRPGRGGIDRLEWALDVSGEPVKAAEYPHRQIRKGVSVAVNKGSRSLLRGAFVATMRSGHRGVFLRRGKARLPIAEQLASRPVDALLHRGEAEAVQERGRDSFARTWARVLPLEIGKVGGGG